MPVSRPLVIPNYNGTTSVKMVNHLWYMCVLKDIVDVKLLLDKNWTSSLSCQGRAYTRISRNALSHILPTFPLRT